MSTVSTWAPAVCSVMCLKVVVVPSTVLRSAGRLGRHVVHEVLLERLVGGVVGGLRDREHGRVAVSAVRVGQHLHLLLGVVQDLLPQVLADVRPVRVDRRRRADVRHRRHRGDVGRHRHVHAGGRRPGAVRRHVDDDGHLRGQLGLVDVLHRRREAPRRVEQDDEGRGVIGLRAVDRVLYEARRDGVDLAVELDREDERALGCGAGGGRNARQAGQDEQHDPEPHSHRVGFIEILPAEFEGFCGATDNAVWAWADEQHVRRS